MTFKLQKLEGDQSKSRGGKGGRKGGDKMSGNVVGGSKFGQIEKECSKVAIELNHGMLVETLKEFMFTGFKQNSLTNGE